MDQAQRRQWLQWTLALALRIGGEVLLPRQPRQGPPAGLRKKGVRDLVTEADEASEHAIVSALRKRFPAHAIVAEEQVRERARPEGWRWYVDPLDGTVNFVHGLPLWSVSIACYGPAGGELGVVYAPALGECFFAARGLGAFAGTGLQDAERIAVTDEGELIEALLVTGFA
ncbi:MAG: hypothetical protein KatS3mg102_2197 [Planctomycetota bacterium]|nr:MAG: hypothetical protein KatS3mg102_2197 [Planctomycetota bacterium]